MKLYPCPCCGFLVFPESTGSYDICTICAWEDDPVQLQFPGLAGGANHQSLWEVQQALIRVLPASETVHGEYRRDPNWRPLTPSEAISHGGPGTGLEYFHAAAAAMPPYYWRTGE